MIQGGGYTATMVEKPTRPPIQNEATNGLRNMRGTVAMARTQSLRSATSQFYINVSNNADLDHTASRRATSATRSSAASSPAWMSSIASRACRPMQPPAWTTCRSSPSSSRASRSFAERPGPDSCRVPLLVIFLTIFVNLVGFGIIIPLLPFYAADVRRVAARHRAAVRVVFAEPARRGADARRSLGPVGRRPILIFSLLGTVVSFVMLAVAHSLAMLFAARIVDGLSGGNITTARAYIADVTTEENRAKAFGLLGAAFGLGFIVGPALGAAVLPHQLHRADLGRRGDHRRRDGARLVLAAGNGAPRAPAAGHPGRRCGRLGGRESLRVLFTVDFVYWTAFAVYQTTFALFGARRFGFDAAHTGYLLSAFGFLGVLVQGVLVGPVVARAGRTRTLAIGLLFAAVGWGGSALTHSLPVFVLMLVPGAIGIGLCNATLSSLISNAAGPHEQGRVQGAAGALESLGRTIGPVWGNGALQLFGEGKAYGSAAIALLGAARLTLQLPASRSAVDRAAPRLAGRRRERLGLQRPDRADSGASRFPNSRSSRVTRSSSCRTMASTVSGWLRSMPAFFNSSIGWSLPPERSSVRYRSRASASPAGCRA